MDTKDSKPGNIDRLGIAILILVVITIVSFSKIMYQTEAADDSLIDDNTALFYTESEVAMQAIDHLMRKKDKR